MAHLKNNSFSVDTKDVRSDRLLLMQTNIDTYSPILGLTLSMLTWGQGCYTAWLAKLAGAALEKGETAEAFLASRSSVRLTSTV